MTIFIQNPDIYAVSKWQELSGELIYKATYMFMIIVKKMCAMFPDALLGYSCSFNICRLAS